jgi:hypothetical protein
MPFASLRKSLAVSGRDRLFARVALKALGAPYGA